MANPYYAPNGYNSYNPAPLYSQFPPPIQNPPPAPQPPPQMPQRPAQFPGQLSQPQTAQQPLSRRARADVIKFPLRQFLLNEQVMVNLQARGWVMGIVLATVKLIDVVAGWGYEVQFTPPGKKINEIDTFPHHSDSIRLP